MAVRGTVAGTSSQTGDYLNFKPRTPAGLKMQTNLAGTSAKQQIRPFPFLAAVPKIFLATI